MGFLPDGSAEKFGNRFEGRYCVSLLLQVLKEQLRSVEIEALGDDEVGVDLWTIAKGGQRVAHQCKAFNESKPTWPIADLKKRGVLEKSAYQLRRDRAVEFWFVSSVMAAELEDLTRHARDCGDDVDRYLEHFIRPFPRADQWKRYCTASGLDPELKADQAIAFDMLKRLRVVVVQDDQKTRNDTESDARMLLMGGSEQAALAALAEIAEDNLHRPLSAEELLRLLEPYGIRLRRLTNSPLVTTALEALRTQFVDSIGPLAGGQLIPRPETRELRRLLESETRSDAIVLHGPPGYGKSGVLLELATELRASGYVVLVVRLDRQTPKTANSIEYGRMLGLPDSPVFCLHDIAAGQRAVLILDQLDALRFTSAHSGEGLMVCKQLLRDAKSTKSFGVGVDVVLACRTFDLERDLEISQWLSRKDTSLTLSKVEVRPLPQPIVRDVVQRTKIDVASLRPRQLALLESVYRLAIWLQMVESDDGAPDFDTHSRLLREYWKRRRLELSNAGCDGERISEVVRRLTSHMEENGCLTAPETLLGDDDKLISELQTCGVISVRSGMVTFGHQSNLDFLVAENAMERLKINDLDLVRWCGQRDEQSLFRREQLRQLLFLMADEDHPRFLDAIKVLLESSKVRFHFKQLALEALGQVNQDAANVEFVLQLLGDAKWSEVVTHQVVHGNVELMQQLLQGGQLSQWLMSSNPMEWKRATHWLVAIADRAPDLAADACRAAMLDLNEWLPRVQPIVSYGAEKSSSDALFGVYLKCLELGSNPPYVDWDGVAKDHPKRVLPLLRSWFLGWVRCHWGKDDPRDDQQLEVNDNAKALLLIARTNPRETWDVLWPVLRSLVIRRRRARIRDMKESGSQRYWSARRLYRCPKTLRRMVVTAGKKLARRAPSVILEMSSSIIVRRSKSLRRLAAQILLGLSSRRSDEAIEWLLADSRRLHCGHWNSLGWGPAARLIDRHSAHCSPEVFARLEARLLSFRDPDEKRNAEYWLKRASKGYFRNGFGEGQQVLLSALASHRRSTESIGRLGVLDRKFGPVTKDCDSRHSRIRSCGVASPIHDHLERLSDRAWIELLSKRELPQKDGRWRQSSKGHYVETSVEEMGRSLGQAVLRDPQRFAKLALRLPPNVEEEYRTQFLSNLCHHELPEKLMLNDADLQQVAVHFSIGETERNATAFSTLLVRRPSVFCDTLLTKLDQCRRHVDPESSESDVGRRGADHVVSNLESIAINGARGVAAYAIAAVVQSGRHRFDMLSPIIEYLIRDPHPAVRIAALEICESVWNVDQPKAFKWFMDAIESDLRVAASDRAAEFYNFLFAEHAEVLQPTIRRMIDSEFEEVAEQGAVQVAARWFFQGLFEPELTRCMTGSTAHKEGIAKVVAHLIWNDRYTEQCLPLAEVLLNDEDQEVRQKIEHQFSTDKFLAREDAGQLIRVFIRSKAFRLDRDHLLWCIKELPGSVERFAEAIFEIADIVAQEAKTPSAEQERYWDLGDLIQLLLRLYEHTVGPDRDQIRRRCLDAWDALLESRPALGWALTRGIEER